MQLPHYSSLEEFQRYLLTRYQVQQEVQQHYSNPLHRILKWFRYRYEIYYTLSYWIIGFCSKRQVSERKLIENIKKTFGANVVLAYGSWNRTTQMRGLIPSPTTRMRSLLSKHFLFLIDVPEYNTTVTCYKCEQKTMHSPFWRLSTKHLLCGKDKMVEVHGLRHCKNESCSVWMNRVGEPLWTVTDFISGL